MRDRWSLADGSSSVVPVVSMISGCTGDAFHAVGALFDDLNLNGLASVSVRVQS